MVFTRGRKQRDWRKVLLILFIVTLLLFATGAIFVRRTYYQNLRPASSSQKSQLFTIPSGASVKEVSQSLHEAGLIRSSWAFETYFRFNNLREYLQAGTYSLRPDMSVREIADVITAGKVATNQVTILPGKRIDEVKDSLINNGFSVEEVDAALQPSTYANHPALVDKPAKASLEGYILPETFQKTATTHPNVIVDAALDELQKVLTPQLRANITKQGLTVHQAIILASIVEKEAGSEKDKPVVAQVFLKRLKEGIKLESDATASYGAVLSGAIDDLVGAEVLSYSSRYNTYENAGLPPGPISNFNRSSLEAVANPAKSDYLFFVAGEDCVTRFSTTVEQHEAFIREHGVRAIGASCS